MHEKWEMVYSDGYSDLHRMNVPGGWLYRLTHYDRGVSITFVPHAHQSGGTVNEMGHP